MKAVKNLLAFIFCQLCVFVSDAQSEQKDGSDHAIHVTTIFTPRSGKAELLQAELVRLLEHAKKETGCLEYQLFRSRYTDEDQGESDTFILREKWMDSCVLNAHKKHKHTKQFVARQEALVETLESQTTLTPL